MPQSYWYVLALLGVMVLSGICRGMVTTTSALQVVDLMTGIFSGICIYLWCRTDAEEKQLPISGRYAGLVGLTGILGATFYVFHTTPRARVWSRFGKGFAVFLVGYLISLALERMVAALTF